MARSGCIFGASGTWKTTAAAHFARWIAETTGKSTLLFSSDGGGWEPCQEEVLAGMIRPYHCDSASIPLPVVRKVSQGYWPRNPEETEISKVDFVPVDWSEVGGIVVEGLTSLGTMLMRHCADKNLKTGEAGTTPFSQPIRVGGEIISETFTQSSRGHYGFVQNQLYSLITNFTSLPVSYVLFTAHEKKYAEDGELQCGISVPGKAITPLVPTWVGDCIHAQDYKLVQKIKVADAAMPTGYREEETVRVKCRYYYEKHIDQATGAIFDAKPRITHSKIGELEKIFPGGFFEPTPDHGFDIYLREIDKLAQDAAQSDSLKGWREKMDLKLGRRPAGVPAGVPAGTTPTGVLTTNAVATAGAPK
jgi:hypothetical protein